MTKQPDKSEISSSRFKVCEAPRPLPEYDPAMVDRLFRPARRLVCLCIACLAFAMAGAAFGGTWRKWDANPVLGNPEIGTCFPSLPLR